MVNVVAFECSRSTWIDRRFDRRSGSRKVQMYNNPRNQKLKKCLQYILPFHIAIRLALKFLCYYQSEYNLTNCTHALQQSKDITCTCMPIYKIITALI